MREKVNNDIVNMQFVLTDKQIIDDLIKALCLNKFVIFRDALRVKLVSEYSLSVKD